MSCNTQDISYQEESCVCVEGKGMCSGVGVCIWVHVYVCIACSQGDHKSVAGVFLSHSLSYFFLRQGLSLNLELTNSTRLTNPRILLSLSPQLMSHHSWHFLHGSWGSKLNAEACGARTLPTEPSPQASKK